METKIKVEIGASEFVDWLFDEDYSENLIAGLICKLRQKDFFLTSLEDELFSLEYLPKRLIFNYKEGEGFEIYDEEEDKVCVIREKWEVQFFTDEEIREGKCTN